MLARRGVHAPPPIRSASPRAARARRGALAGATASSGTTLVVEPASPATTCAAFLKLDVGGYDPLLGASYGEIAADSRSMHKSQGFGVARERGPRSSTSAARWRRARRRSDRSSTASTSTWRRFARRRRSSRRRSTRARERFDAARARRRRCPRWSRSTPRSTRCPTPWRAREAREVERPDRSPARACSSRRPPPTHASSPGGDVEVTATALNRSPAPVDAARAVAVRRAATRRGAGSAAAAPRQRRGRVRSSARCSVPADAAARPRPTGSDAPPDGAASMHVADARARRSARGARAPLAVDVRARGRGPALRGDARRSRTSGPIRCAGERYRPLEVTPAVVGASRHAAC